MTPPEDQLRDTLRTAFRQTAEQIPAVPPPLRLPPSRQSVNSRGRRPAHHPGWRTWLTPLAAAALVVAVIAASFVLVSAHRTQPSSPPEGPSSVPSYYVALLTNNKPAETATEAQVRSTATGAVLATITPPKPYAMFTGITAAANDRTFVLSVQVKPNGPWPFPGTTNGSPSSFYSAQAAFFVLQVLPGRGPGHSVATEFFPLPASFVRANTAITDMALSPDGRSLATDLLDATGSRLYVFNVVTGAKREWSAQVCEGTPCRPASGGLGFGGVNVDALSWTADGHKIAFFWDGRIRLLDITKPGENLLTDSTVIVPLQKTGTAQLTWRGGTITPDGRTVVATEEIVPAGPVTAVPERLVTFSATTGQLTATLNRANAGPYEQVLWTNASGGVLVVYGARGLDRIAILQAGSYTFLATPKNFVTGAW